LTNEGQYECEECRRKAKDPEVCCGKPMKQLPLEICISPPASAEHARPMDEEEACDDSRSG
jgi:hypothetical protein